MYIQTTSTLKKKTYHLKGLLIKDCSHVSCLLSYQAIFYTAGLHVLHNNIAKALSICDQNILEFAVTISCFIYTYAFLNISLLSMLHFSMYHYFFLVFDHYCSLHLNCLRKCHQQSAGLSAVSLTGQCHPGAEYVLSSDNRGDSGM